MSDMCPEGFVSLELHTERVAELEREIQDRANAQLQLVADKERLIYHVLRLLETPIDEDREPRDVARLCLERFGYAEHSNRAIRMLDLGEPGTHAVGLVAPKPISEHESMIAIELQHRLRRHVGSRLTPRRLEALKAEALVCVREFAEQHAVDSVPAFDLEQDPDDPSRVVIVWKERF